MKLARYTHGNTPHASITTLGVVVDERVLPLSALDPAAVSYTHLTLPTILLV